MTFYHEYNVFRNDTFLSVRQSGIILLRQMRGDDDCILLV